LRRADEPSAKRAVALNLSIIPKASRCFESVAVRRDIVIFGDDQSEATFCLLLVIRKPFLCSCTIFVAIVGNHWGNNHTILQGHTINCNWTEYMI
jgi:hypothetical protein